MRPVWKGYNTASINVKVISYLLKQNTIMARSTLLYATKTWVWRYRVPLHSSQYSLNCFLFQDTLVALEAISRWSSLYPPLTTPVKVQVQSGEVRTITLMPEVKIPEILKMNVNDQLNVSVEGEIMLFESYRK